VDAGCLSALKMAEYMPTVALIRRECSFHRGERIGIQLESAEFQERWEEMRARGLEYAETIKAKIADPLPPPKLPPENLPVIATRERLELLAKQAKQMKAKYPPNDVRMKQAEALAGRQ